MPREPVDPSEEWRRILEEGEEYRRLRAVFKRLPADPRCRLCHVPFRGIGGAVVRATRGLKPSTLNPRFCNDCELIGAENPGGAEVDVAMLFADVRGSTSLGERLTPLDYSSLIDRFYRDASRVLIQADALIESLAGDGITAIFVAGLAGDDFVERAIEAGRGVLHATGRSVAGRTELPVGVGIHYGRAFVGTVGETGGVATIGALGDTVNVAARLSDRAAAGEMLVSVAAWAAAGRSLDGAESRRLTLKGRTEPVDVIAVAAIDPGPARPR